MLLTCCCWFCRPFSATQELEEMMGSLAETKVSSLIHSLLTLVSFSTVVNPCLQSQSADGWGKFFKDDLDHSSPTDNYPSYYDCPKGRLSELFCAVLCTTVVLNYVHCTLIWAVLTSELGPVGLGLVSFSVCFCFIHNYGQFVCHGVSYFNNIIINRHFQNAKLTLKSRTGARGGYNQKHANH